MELQGRVIVVMEPREGTSARGPWKSQQYVIETHDQYPKKMVFDIFGADRIDQFAIKAGEEIIVSFDVDAHEYNGRHSRMEHSEARCCSCTGCRGTCSRYTCTCNRSANSDKWQSGSVPASCIGQ